jgi:hypothetical protein
MMFRQIVAGAVVTTQSVSGQPVEIILADIGWVRMVRAILDAMEH